MNSKDLEIVRGDDKYLTLTFKDAVGAVINITGWTVFFTAKTKLSDLDTEAVISKTITSHTDPTHGVTQIHITAANTTPLNGTYHYDIQIKKITTSDIYTVLLGKLEIRKDVTIRTSA